MGLLLYLPLLMPAVAALAARPLAAWLAPAQATWLFTVAAVVLAGCGAAALALLAACAVARVPLLATLGSFSGPVVRRGDPVSALTGTAAAVALTGAGLAVAVAVRRRARALAESYRRAAGLGCDSDVVVVPGLRIEAYALPGAPGRVVVSGRLLGALPDDGRAALLAHEHAHLAGRHHLFTSVARLAAAANPLLLPLASAVDYTVERWADEHAARVTGDRRLVAATIAEVALLAGPRRRRRTAAALGITGPDRRRRAAAAPGTAGPRRPTVAGAGPAPRRVSVAWAGPVPRRVAALLAPPPRSRFLLLAAAGLALLLAGASALQAARDLHALLELAGAIH